jgi:hypothetical protein
MLPALEIISAALFASELWLLVYGRFHLAGLAALATSVVIVAEGIISHSLLVTGLGAAGILAYFVIWRGGRDRRRRTRREAIGEESRQVRDGLVRRWRGTRPGWSLSPSR